MLSLLLTSLSSLCGFQSWTFYRDNINHWLNHDEKAGVCSDMVYRSEDLDTFHNLVTHDGLGGKQAPELMMQCHVVVFLVRLMVALGYLNKARDDLEFGEEEMLAGQILHHFRPSSSLSLSPSVCRII